MIPFSKPSITKLEMELVQNAMKNNILSGDGKYTQKAVHLLSEIIYNENIFLTTSGTDALEMASLLINLEPGDEVITPSFTFSSTANAFILRRANPVFCEIRTDTMNIDESRIESLITPKTKAIFTVAYAGVPCEMDVINKIAKKYNLVVVDDAAQAVGSCYNNKPAGTLSPLGCFSFHETKNYIMGEGGALIINDQQYLRQADIVREKGTNRKEAVLGMVDKYTWHSTGSSYLPSDILAALLTAQLQRFDEIMDKRMNIWNLYHKGLEQLESNQKLKRPHIPENCQHNAHMYYVILPDKSTRDFLMTELKKKDISAYFHYIPLHSSPFGKEFGYSAEMLPKTEEYAGRLLRLPLYADMSITDVEFVLENIDKILRKM